MAPQTGVSRCKQRRKNVALIGTIVTVETIATPHDGVDGVVFVVDDGKHRLGILTDLGHVFSGLGDVIASLDAVLLESNFDPDMLENGSYPELLEEANRGIRRAYFQHRSRRIAANCRLETHEMGLLGSSLPRQQHARPGVENASEESWATECRFTLQLGTEASDVTEI